NRNDVDARMNRIHTLNDLTTYTHELTEKGILNEQRDGPALLQLLGQAWQTHLNKERSLTFLPEGVFEALVRRNLYSQPTFYGIPSHTQLARIVVESDCSLKSLGGPEGHDLKPKLAFHQTFLEWYLSHSQRAELQAATPPLGVIQVLPREVALAA